MTDTSRNGAPRHVAASAAGTPSGRPPAPHGSVSPDAPLYWPDDEAPAAPPAAPPRERMSGGARWAAFAGVLLVLLGLYQAIEGFVTLRNPDYYGVASGRLAVDVGYTTWGWVHLVLGVIAVLAGIGIFLGNTAARFAGIGIAVISAIVNLAFAAAYPAWAGLLIALDVVLIWAITTHGDELAEHVR